MFEHLTDALRKTMHVSICLTSQSYDKFSTRAIGEGKIFSRIYHFYRKLSQIAIPLSAEVGFDFVKRDFTVPLHTFGGIYRERPWATAFVRPEA
jgi:hypothetical protein